MTWKELCELGRRLPEVSEGTWFRTPSLEVRGKSFVRLKEDESSVVFLTDSVDEQQFLIRSRPRIYFITPHYGGYPAVLARLSTLTISEARLRLEVAWRMRAPRALVRQMDEAGSGTAKTRRPTK
jgi:hypothetical protein